jgi:tetratricopeptide (TPR) repeat protein
LVQQRRGELEPSVESFLVSLEKSPRAVEPRVALTRSLLALQRYDEAERQVLAALEAGADEVVATNLLGDVYAAAGRLADAGAQYSKAIGRRPDAPLAYQRLARLQLAEGDADAAVATLRSGIEATAGSQQLQATLPLVLEQAGRTDEAIDAYEAVIAANPNADVAANNLAMLLAERGADNNENLARALTLAQRFENSEEPAFLDTLGWVHYRSGDYQRALEYMERARDAGAPNPQRQFHLGMTYLKLGRAEDAKRQLAAALESEQTFAGMEQARSALESL